MEGIRKRSVLKLFKSKSRVFEASSLPTKAPIQNNKKRSAELLNCGWKLGQMHPIPGFSRCFSPSRDLRGVTAEVVVLNSAMRGCERSGRWIEALMLLEDTKVLGADEVSILI